MFDVGDNVVYPHHGAGTVVSKESRIVLGQEREYLTIKILHNDMTVNVPTENAEKVGLRWVIGLDAVEVVVKALSGESTEMPKNWPAMSSISWASSKTTAWNSGRTPADPSSSLTARSAKKRWWLTMMMSLSPAR